jgi:site-specific DNA recombinase
VDPEDWILVSVPALIAPDLFEAVQEQLRENKQTARIHKSGARYLLQGLIVCARCGYAYYGKPVSPASARGRERHYVYYRCIGSDAYRFGGERRCGNRELRSDYLELAVWQEVRRLLEEPERLEEELGSRMEPTRDDADLNATNSRIARLRQGISRLIDSYAEGMIEKSEFDPRLKVARERIAQLEEHAAKLRDMAARQEEMALVVGRLTDFARSVEEGLDSADWTTRREIIRALIKRVEVDEDQVNIVFRVEPNTKLESPGKCVLQDCRRSDYPALRRTIFRLPYLPVFKHACI